MTKVILIDVHNTLLEKDLTPNKNLIKIVNTLSKSYDIAVFTAEKISKELLIKQVNETSLNTYSCYCMNVEDQEDMSDVEIKLELLKDIQKHYKIAALIDNSKKVTKEFAKLGIDSFQFREKLTNLS